MQLNTGSKLGRQILSVTPEMLVALFAHDAGVRFTGMPSDARFVCAWHDGAADRFRVMVESASFPLSAPGSQLKHFEVTVTVESPAPASPAESPVLASASGAVE